jgi:hypothetical protein
MRPDQSLDIMIPSGFARAIDAFLVGLSKRYMELRTGRHVVFMFHAYLVFTTKRGGKVLRGSISIVWKKSFTTCAQISR